MTLPPPARLVTWALTVGLTPLIPVPLVDDWVKSLLLRRMLKGVAGEEQVSLDDATLDALLEEPPGCFAGGMLKGCLLFPFRRMLRKILIFLEWKRSIDLIARTWVFGTLFQTALRQGWRPEPGHPTPDRLREAAEEAMAEVGTSPVEHAVEAVVRGAKTTMQGAADLVRQAVENLDARPNPDEVERAMRQLEAGEARRLEPVRERLQDSLAAVPEDYMRRLLEAFNRRLEGPGGPR